MALESNKFYVGIATDPNKRFKQHKAQDKDCASFCKKYKAKKLIEIIDTETKQMIEACKLEDKITVQYMNKYGSSNVRGGRYLGSDKQVLKKYLFS